MSLHGFENKFILPPGYDIIIILILKFEHNLHGTCLGHMVQKWYWKWNNEKNNTCISTLLLLTCSFSMTIYSLRNIVNLNDCSFLRNMEFKKNIATQLRYSINSPFCDINIMFASGALKFDSFIPTKHLLLLYHYIFNFKPVSSAKYRYQTPTTYR